jgi:hypothetical protein
MSRAALVWRVENVPLDTDDESKLGLGGDEEGLVLLSSTLRLDHIALGLAVLGGVLLGTLEDDGALALVGLRQS